MYHYFFTTFSPQMRAVVFYVYLSLLLLCGGYALYASMHYSHTGYSSARNAVKRQHSKLANGNQNNTVIDDADIDLDEDNLSGADAEEGGAKQLIAGKYALTNRWYLTFSRPLILNNYQKSFKVSPSCCGDSSPIYITQRVLRI